MLPRVSVIVPVLNAAGHVDGCLEAIRAQTYPAGRLELIVVDNGSVDETRGRVRDHGATLIVERGGPSPYVARNAGIGRADGEIFAFTDSDCVPAKNWIERGVAQLEEEGADLAGGTVRFRFDGPPGAAQLLDAIENLDQERSIEQLNVAKAANLFVRREVFAELGPFCPRRRSGADVALCSRAAGSGFTLVYAPDAQVTKPARSGLPLARKQYRVGRGECLLWRERGAGAREIAGRVLRSFGPARPSYIRERLRTRGPEGSEPRWPAVWLGSWWIGAVQGLGRLRGWTTPRPR